MLLVGWQVLWRCAGPWKRPGCACSATVGGGATRRRRSAKRWRPRARLWRPATTTTTTTTATTTTMPTTSSPSVGLRARLRRRTIRSTTVCPLTTGPCLRCRRRRTDARRRPWTTPAESAFDPHRIRCRSALLFIASYFFLSLHHIGHQSLEFARISQIGSRSAPEPQTAPNPNRF